MYRTGESLLSAAKRFLLINIHETVGTEGHGQSMPKGPSQEASYWLIAPPRTALHAASSLAPSISSFGVFKPFFGSKLHRIHTPQGNPLSSTVTFPKELSHGQLLLVCNSFAFTVSRRLIEQISNPNPLHSPHS